MIEESKASNKEKTNFLFATDMLKVANVHLMYVAIVINHSHFDEN